MYIKCLLQPDLCQEYHFWNNYFQQHDDIASVDFTSEHYRTTLNETARNLRNRAVKKGYYCRELSITERNLLLDDIHAINTSMKEGQGKEMKASYTTYPKEYTDNPSKCFYHYSRWFGVFEESTTKLVGYIVGAFCGDLAASSMILGHGDYLKDGIMYLLYEYFMAWSFKNGHTVIVYSRWSDGTDGLRTFKHNIGLSCNKIITE